MNEVYLNALTGKGTDRTILLTAIRLAQKLVKQYNEIIIILCLNKAIRNESISQCQEFKDARNAIAFYLPLIANGNKRLSLLNQF